MGEYQSKYPEIVMDNDTNSGASSMTYPITIEQYYDLLHHTHNASDIIGSKSDEGEKYNADNVKINIDNLSKLNGKDLKDFTFADLMNTLNYSKASVSLSSDLPGLYYENGIILNGTTLPARVVKGSDPITEVEFFKGSTSVNKITTGVENGGVFTYRDPTNISTDTAYKVTIKYGTNDTASSSISVKFYFPYFYGITEKNINDITEDDIISLTKDVSSKGTKKYTYTSNNQYCIIAYPKSYGLLKSVLDPNGFQNIDSMVYKEVTVKNSPYYIYQTNVTVTCDNFTYTFSY